MTVVLQLFQDWNQVNHFNLAKGGSMRKISDYVEMAANEYLQETGKDELDALWVAEYFQDCGVLDDYPMQDLVDFFTLVQKSLTVIIARTEKLTRLQQGKSSRTATRKNKP
jgi:hypothetical protein